MRKFIAAAAALGAIVAMSTAAQASIVYNINQTSTTPEVSGELSPLSDTVSGTITTDGTIGVLQTANILGWNLTLTDNYRPAFDVTLTPSNSGIWYNTGNGLSASATQLSFDFSKSGAVFIIQGLTHGFSSGYQYFCFQADTGPCLAGETIVPEYYAHDGVLASGLVGSVPLSGPTVPSGTPEPATWSMMMLGLGGLGAVLRSRRRMAPASAA